MDYVSWKFAGNQNFLCTLSLCMAFMYHNRFAWRHQLKELRQTFKVVAPDLRGYGFSDKPSGLEHYRMDALLEDVRSLIEILGSDEKTGEWKSGL